MVLIYMLLFWQLPLLTVPAGSRGAAWQKLRHPSLALGRQLEVIGTQFLIQVIFSSLSVDSWIKYIANWDWKGVEKRRPGVWRGGREAAGGLWSNRGHEAGKEVCVAGSGRGGRNVRLSAEGPLAASGGLPCPILVMCFLHFKNP